MEILRLGAVRFALLQGLTRLYTGEFCIADPDGNRSLKAEQLLTT